MSIARRGRYHPPRNPAGQLQPPAPPICVTATPRASTHPEPLTSLVLWALRHPRGPRQAEEDAITFIKEEQVSVLERQPTTDLAISAEELPDPAMAPEDLATDAVRRGRIHPGRFLR
jgi:hypothetical protein